MSDTTYVIMRNGASPSDITGVTRDMEAAVQYADKEKMVVVEVRNVGNSVAAVARVRTLHIVTFNSDGAVVAVNDTKLHDPKRIDNPPIVSKLPDRTTEIWLFAFNRETARAVAAGVYAASRWQQ